MVINGMCEKEKKETERKKKGGEGWGMVGMGTCPEQSDQGTPEQKGLVFGRESQVQS